MYRFGVDDREEVERLITERGVWLRTTDTGVHYRLSRFHTDTVHLLSPVFCRGPNRGKCARCLLDAMRKQGINPQDIDILLGTGIGAMPLVYTLQHFESLEHTRAMYMERRDGGVSAVGNGFSFKKDERIFLIHPAGVTYHRIRQTIDAVYAAVPLAGQPCINGFAVLIDRSPDDAVWKKNFAAYQYAVGIRSPINAYPSDPYLCPLCLQNTPLVDIGDID